MSWLEPEKPLSVGTVTRLLEEDDLQYFYNIGTGEFHSTFSNKFLDGFYGDVDELLTEGDQGDEPDLEASDWIALPGADEIEDLRWMRDFARSQPDPLGEWLLDAAYARHPYRSFKDEARRHGVLDAWWGYRRERLRDIASTWFEQNGIEPAS
ncbi:UPF0158 family protein [Atopobium sp. oral taxon 810]|uniref:UPF0158 family protein n=1 Tax=Atopobium sp. oral taxon 810 TaxID=712158 RepID=UPI00039614D7|nr:UPF0158 family protein [Atopobium sp. oral taxon 810]ERI05413.1 hypothetical protein HMPREF9069_00847 [Atopobium sp. oral taxon 810 str. F0209]